MTESRGAVSCQVGRGVTTVNSNSLLECQACLAPGVMFLCGNWDGSTQFVIHGNSRGVRSNLELIHIRSNWLQLRFRRLPYDMSFLELALATTRDDTRALSARPSARAQKSFYMVLYMLYDFI